MDFLVDVPLWSVPDLTLNQRVWTRKPIARRISLTMIVMDNLRCRLSRWFLPSRLRSPEAIELSELSPSRTAEDFSTENSPPASCDRLIGQCFRIALALGSS